MPITAEESPLSTVLAILGWTAFGLAIVAGLVLDMVGLFGNWIILGAVAIAWLATGFEHFGTWGLVAMTGLAVMGEIIELIASSFGAARFGGGKGAAFAALIGCIVGAIVGTPWFPVVGTLIGACLGAFVAAAAYEFVVTARSAGDAAWTGVGAALGKVAGVFGKALMGLMMLLVAAFTF